MTPTTTTGIGTSTEHSAGIPAEDHGWEKAVIAHWCGVQVLDIDAEHTARSFDQDSVAIIEIVVTVRTPQDAQAMAVLLDLPAMPTDPAVAWQTWTGWVSTLSAQRPVLVTVTSPTTHREA